jgi:ABC-type cobalamin/Fe3+-siderophores transport system ATPase subunit
MYITEFFVSRLHDHRSVRMTIADNKLVLVGENGTGKTTIINLLYYFLSCQWGRIAAYRFNTVGAVINGEEVTVARSAIEAALSRQERSYPRARLGIIRRQLLDMDPALVVENEELARDIAIRVGAPVRLVLEAAHELVDSQLDLGVTLEGLTKNIRERVTSQLLYLPTYRRIEQDLKDIFPEVDSERFRTVERRVSARNRGGHIELVQFGMEDVAEALNSKVGELKDHLRNGLNNLTGKYLREVIAGEYQSVTAETLSGLDLATLEAILGRIDERVLPNHSKGALRRIVADVRREETIRNDQKVVAHFLLRLLELYNEQQRAESSIRQFVALCNSYLAGKKVVYDDHTFQIYVQLTDHRAVDLDPSDSGRLSLKTLSSGEKQIVSLFSHLLVAGTHRSFVLIDEPELSLSVPWQRQFLPDIIATGQCEALIAVTHSPFVFDNALDGYAHEIAEFWI